MSTRTERDTFGTIEVPSDHFWGAQTQRALEHFAISTETMPQEIIRALTQIKRAAATVNAQFQDVTPLTLEQEISG
jgi:fumarate hydratase class II